MMRGLATISRKFLGCGMLAILGLREFGASGLSGERNRDFGVVGSEEIRVDSA